MQIAPLPEDEGKRLAKLRSFGVLDTLPQKAFDDITALASAICSTPIALISLIDSDRQWFKSRLGLEAPQTGREVAFCSHAILKPAEVMVVEDAKQDDRFRDNPLVTEAPDIRFYAGAPIVTDDGFALGTVCVIDQQPRQLNASQLQALRSLASLVVTLLEHEKTGQEANRLKAAEAARRTEYLAALNASGLDLMSFVDTSCVYRYVNKAYLTYWGREAREIIDMSVAEILGDELFRSTIKPLLDQALAGQQVVHEAAIDFPGVGLRHMEVTYLPALDEQGKVRGAIIRSHDIHALKKREDQLRDTVAMLEQKTLEQERFIHIVSHDLREPINTINNFTSLLTSDQTLALPDTAKRYLSFVKSGGERMAVLVEDMLNLLGLERHAVNHQSVDFTLLASQVREDLSAALERTGGRIEFGHLPATWGDPSLLRIALQNLVVNGLKFVAKGQVPIVSITAKAEDGKVHISVSDNGIGMASEQLEKIFEMFKRLHSRKEYAGTGLGLSICRRIAELHRGSVRVTSKPGQGSCFTLTLPAPPKTLEERHGDEYL